MSLGRDADPSPPSSAFGHERVELYLYSPCGPYGLYRASKLSLSAPRRHTASAQLHSYVPSALGGQRSTNYTPRSLYSQERTRPPIEQEARLVSEPVRAFWRKEKSHS